MELSLLVWLLPTLALVIGVAVGFIVARLLPNAAPSNTQRQLDDIQKRFDSYQNEVVTHFNSTASLVKKLTQSYQEVQDHLAEGANRLALDEQTRQRLIAALHADAARGQPGQIAVAAALRGLLDGSAIRHSHDDCDRVQDPYSLRCQPQVMGAVLDLLRQAATTLRIEARSVAEACHPNRFALRELIRGKAGR